MKSQQAGSRGKGCWDGQARGGPRKGHEWEQAVTLIDYLAIDEATRQRIYDSPFSDARIYTVLRDCRDGRDKIKSPGGWVISLLKGMLPETEDTGTDPRKSAASKLGAAGPGMEPRKSQDPKHISGILHQLRRGGGTERTHATEDQG